MTTGFARATAAAVVGCVCAACATTPTTPTTTRLEIRPPLTGLALGDTQTFQLVQVAASAETPRADAVWSVDRPEVLAIDAVGRATPLTVGTATLSARAGTQSAAQSVRVVANIAGTWTGQLLVLDDRRVSGDGPFRAAPGLKAPLEFNLQQTHDVVSGSGVILAPLPTGAVGPVSGDWQSSSQLRLRGTFKTDEGFEAEFTTWTSDVAPDASSITGRFTMTTRFTNFWGPQVIVKDCEIATLTRVAR